MALSNEELEREINQLKQRLSANFTFADRETIRNEVIKQKSTLAQSDVQRTITIPDGGGSEDVLEYPAGFLALEWKGKRYNIPYFE